MNSKLICVYICVTICCVHSLFASEATFKVNRKTDFSPIFVFRRSETFTVEIYSENYFLALQRNQSDAKPTISVRGILETSEKEKHSFRFTFGDDIKDKNDWKITDLRVNGPYLDFNVNIALNTPVGLWNVTIELHNATSNLDQLQFRTFVLFCAQCPDDYVYIDNEFERRLYLSQEYEVAFNPLMDKKFLIYKQSSQFVLEAVNGLMRNASISAVDRNYPIKVVSAMLNRIMDAYNKMDEKVKETEKEKGDFIDQLVAALKELLRRMIGGSDSNKPKEVARNVTLEDLEIEDFFLNVKNLKSVLQKAGEKDWFLSSVVVAICRTLGIPAHIVTVVNANAGMKNKMIVDYKKLNNLKSVEQSLFTDYDLWVQVWTKQSNKSATEGGWQVVDFGIDEMARISIKGPVSVEAIRNGVKNDACKYFIAAIYGDERQQFLDNNFVISRDRHCNAVKIVTSYNRLKHGNETPSVFADITGNYYKQANGNCSQTNSDRSTLFVSSNDGNDFKLRIIEEINGTLIGDPFRFTLQIEHNCDGCDYESILGKVTVRSIRVKKEKENVIEEFDIVADNVDRNVLIFNMEVKPEKYLPKLNGIAALRIEALVHETRTSNLFALYNDIKLKLPSVVAKEVAYTGEYTHLMLNIDNSINRTIEKARLIIDGLDFKKVTFDLEPIYPLQRWKQAIAVDTNLIYKYILASLKTEYFQIPDINLILN